MGYIEFYWSSWSNSSSVNFLTTKSCLVYFTSDKDVVAFTKVMILAGIERIMLRTAC